MRTLRIDSRSIQSLDSGEAFLSKFTDKFSIPNIIAALNGLHRPNGSQNISSFKHIDFMVLLAGKWFSCNNIATYYVYYPIWKSVVSYKCTWMDENENEVLRYPQPLASMQLGGISAFSCALFAHLKRAWHFCCCEIDLLQMFGRHACTHGGDDNRINCMRSMCARIYPLCVQFRRRCMAQIAQLPNKSMWQKSDQSTLLICSFVH